MKELGNNPIDQEILDILVEQGFSNDSIANKLVLEIMQNVNSVSINPLEYLQRNIAYVDKVEKRSKSFLHRNGYLLNAIKRDDGRNS